MIDIGRLGIWSSGLRSLDAGALAEAVGALDEYGYGAVWFPGGRPDAAITLSEAILSNSTRLAVATGIISIWTGPATDLARAHRTMRERYPGRFVLGLGVSHPESVNREETRSRRPIAEVRAYLDELDVEDPEGRPERVLAALGPRMLRLAAERTGGAHPYFAPIDHVAFARDVLGPRPLLAPEKAVVLEADPERARAIGRAHVTPYLRLQNYTNNLRRFGFDDDDFAAPVSDRLIDAVVAWGDVETVAAAIADHYLAGADHVCVQFLTDPPGTMSPSHWQQLAEAIPSGSSRVREG
jgi:probable F420-dependent oxidoreductase